MHVLYFWKALSTGMLELILPGVWHANTQTQIHKYCVYTNTVNDEMSVNPMKCYIFGKPMMQGCWKRYLELSTMPIQKMCLTLSPLVSLMYRAKCINPRVNNSPKCIAPKLPNMCLTLSPLVSLMYRAACVTRFACNTGYAMVFYGILWYGSML